MKIIVTAIFASVVLLVGVALIGLAILITEFPWVQHVAQRLKEFCGRAKCTPLAAG
jgi:hypothetical protein